MNDTVAIAPLSTAPRRDPACRSAAKMLSSHETGAMHWDYILILIFLGAVVPLMGRWRVERILRGPEPAQTDRLRLYASTIAFQWIIAAVIFWRVAKHGMATAALGLGAPPPVLTAIVSVALVALLLANQLLSLRQVGVRPQELHSKLAQLALRIFPQDTVERLAFLGVVSTVAICEEWIFRGFAQALFQQWSHLAAIGVVGSACLFSLAHLYQGRRGLIATFIVGMLFSICRLVTGSLIPAVAGHFVVDLMAGYMFPSRLRRALSTEAEMNSVARAGGIAE